MKNTMLGGALAFALALVMVLATAPMAGEGGWQSDQYRHEEMGPATSSPQTDTEEMAPAVPGQDQEMNKEEMTPSASQPQKGEEMAPADSGSRHEEYKTPENAPYRAPAESQPY